MLSGWNCLLFIALITISCVMGNGSSFDRDLHTDWVYSVRYGTVIMKWSSNIRTESNDGSNLGIMWAIYLGSWAIIRRPSFCNCLLRCVAKPRQLIFDLCRAQMQREVRIIKDQPSQVHHHSCNLPLRIQCILESSILWRRLLWCRPYIEAHLPLDHSRCEVLIWRGAGLIAYALRSILYLDELIFPMTSLITTDADNGIFKRWLAIER